MQRWQIKPTMAAAAALASLVAGPAAAQAPLSEDIQSQLLICSGRMSAVGVSLVMGWDDPDLKKSGTAIMNSAEIYRQAGAYAFKSRGYSDKTAEQFATLINIAASVQSADMLSQLKDDETKLKAKHIEWLSACEELDEVRDQWAALNGKGDQQ